MSATSADRSPRSYVCRGVEMPLLGLGTWQASTTRRYEAVRRRSRSATGTSIRPRCTATRRASAARCATAALARDEIFVTTKLPAERGWARAGDDRGQSRGAGLDYVDLWLVHWPPSGRRAGDVEGSSPAATQGWTRRSASATTRCADRRADRRDRRGAGGQPDPVGPALTTPAAGRATASAAWSSRATARSRQPTLRRPDARRDRQATGSRRAQVVLRWHSSTASR